MGMSLGTSYSWLIIFALLRYRVNSMATGRNNNRHWSFKTSKDNTTLNRLMVNWPFAFIYLECDRLMEQMGFMLGVVLITLLIIVFILAKDFIELSVGFVIALEITLLVATMSIILCYVGYIAVLASLIFSIILFMYRAFNNNKQDK